MVNFGEDWTKTATEATQTAQEVVRHYVDESAAFSRAYMRVWNSVAQSALSIAYLQQEAVLQSSRAMVDANAQAGRDWLNQMADSMHVAQDATTKMTTATAALADSVLNSARS
ncbi:MAG: hypothetical protein ACYC4L_19410 [Chloroflexota bacterium]